MGPIKSFWTFRTHSSSKKGLSFSSYCPNINQILGRNRFHAHINQTGGSQRVPGSSGCMTTFSSPATSTNIIGESLFSVIRSWKICSILPSVMINATWCAEIYRMKERFMKSYLRMQLTKIQLTKMAIYHFILPEKEII